MLPSSFANRLVSLDFFATLNQQKELAFAFGGQHSIHLSYGDTNNFGLSLNFLVIPE